MTKAKKGKIRQRAYSYSEYVETFYPNHSEIPKPFAEPESLTRQDPKTIGATLALISLEKARRELESRRRR